MTFSVVAISQDGRYLAAATASRSLASGNAVPALAPGVGAVVTQAYTNKSFRHVALDLARRGSPAEEILQELGRLDDGFAMRQVAVLRTDGTTAAHNGADCSPWSGSIAGDGFVALGNLLVGPGVVRAMAEQLDTSGPETGSVSAFAQRLLSALQAGQAAGGDQRGQQSAALMIAENGAPDTSPPELRIDLRVDDAVEPLVQLDRLLHLWRADHHTDSSGGHTRHE